MNKDFLLALDQITKEKGISPDVIFEALEAALVSSYKKNYGTSQNAIVKINKKNGDIKVFAEFDIVEEVVDDSKEIDIKTAKEIDQIYNVGDTYLKEITPSKFGRIAAQTAKQVVIQRIKDAERDVIYNNYIDKENELITGVIQRINRNIIYFDLGQTEAILPPSEQIEGINYQAGDRLKLYVLEVKKTTKGPQIILSRSHPSLIKRLFELEIPEIQEGTVEIYSIAREAGSRTKIAVYSKNEEVDPLGACVGYKGSRVKAIVDEIDDEKIDIVIYDKRIRNFIANALSPSKVVEVVVNEKEKSALVIVPDYQLSLAIGKEGQNARLAAKLTNWKIDIKSESQFDEYYESLSEEEQEELNDLMNMTYEEEIKYDDNHPTGVSIEDLDSLDSMYSSENDDLEEESFAYNIENDDEEVSLDTETDSDFVENVESISLEEDKI